MLRPSEAVNLCEELVELLGRQLAEYKSGPDGRLFRTYRDGVYQPSTPWQVLQKARRKVLTKGQLSSPLARKPYDFRHAGVSWRLNAGVPAVYVAEWAGHNVEGRGPWPLNMLTTEAEPRFRAGAHSFVLSWADASPPVPHIFRRR